jgi:hypothetical protein
VGGEVMPIRLENGVIGYSLEDVLELLEYPKQQLNQPLCDRDRDYWEGYMEAVFDLFPDALEVFESQNGTEDS